MEFNEIIIDQITTIKCMLLAEGVIIDTNRDDGVVFPISILVRELELRMQRT